MTKKTLKRKFNTQSCHPSIRSTKKRGKKNNNNGFCLLSKNIVQGLKKRFNFRHPDMKIKSSKIQEIHKELQSKLSDVCFEERCWIQELYSSDSKKTIDKYFAPSHPKSWNNNKNTWLNSLDITRVMKQFEEAHKSFRFLGPSPMDFSTIKQNMCIYPEICNLNLQSMKKNKVKYIGIIFNTDYHYEPGSHWVCVFIDIEKNIFFFFDSTGDECQDEIKSLYDKLRQDCPKLKFKTTKNMKHQYKNTECGVYCLYVISSLLEGKTSISSLQRKRISDEKMEQYRNVYFNQPLHEEK